MICVIACNADRALLADSVRASSLYRLRQQPGQTAAPDNIHIITLHLQHENHRRKAVRYNPPAAVSSGFPTVSENGPQ